MDDAKARIAETLLRMNFLVAQGSVFWLKAKPREKCFVSLFIFVQGYTWIGDGPPLMAGCQIFTRKR
jgi:hypothetical protein